MWERDRGVLCGCPPNQKDHKTERSLCAGVPERGQQLQRALGAARINRSQPGPSWGQQELQGGEGSTRLCAAWRSAAALPTKGHLQKQVMVLHDLYVAFALFPIPVMGRSL